MGSDYQQIDYLLKELFSTLEHPLPAEKVLCSFVLESNIVLTHHWQTKVIQYYFSSPLFIATTAEIFIEVWPKSREADEAAREQQLPWTIKKFALVKSIHFLQKQTQKLVRIQIFLKIMAKRKGKKI